MTKAQKKIVFNWLVVALLLIMFTIFDDLILNHWETLKWPAFVILIIVVILSKNAPMPTRAERHLEFNRTIDENPWIKIYLVVYGIVIAIGDYYAISNQINIIEKISFIEFLSAILLLFLPIFIIKHKEAWNEAGR